MGEKKFESGEVEGARRASAGSPDSSRAARRPQRFSARKKGETVVRLLRGEDLELVSRELGVTAARLWRWREAFVAGGQQALRKQGPGTRDEEVWTGQGQACLFVAVDHCTCECIGIHASRSGNRWQALEPLRQGVRCYLGGFAAAVAPGLEIRHDHGSAYLSDDFQSEIAFWGMESSPAFVREPEGNGCAERFIRTLKENLLWTRSFDTIDELREALLEFRDRYNQEWIIERHSYRTPNQVRRDWEAMKQSAA